MKNSSDQIFFDINTTGEKTCISTSLRGGNKYSFTYMDNLKIPDYFVHIMKSLVNMSKEFDFSIKGREYTKSGTIHFIPSKMGGDIIDFTTRDRAAEFHIGTGFILLDGKIYIGKIEKLVETSSGNLVFGESCKWKKSYRLDLKEVILPDTGRQIKKFNMVYNTKKGVYTWDQSKFEWSYVEKTK